MSRIVTASIAWGRRMFLPLRATGRQIPTSVEVSAFDLQAVDMQIRDEDVACLDCSCRRFARIGSSGRTMRKFVSPARCRSEFDIPIGKAVQTGREVKKLLGDEMDDVALPLDTSVDRHHR